MPFRFAPRPDILSLFDAGEGVGRGRQNRVKLNRSLQAEIIPPFLQLSTLYRKNRLGSGKQ